MMLPVPVKVGDLSLNFQNGAFHKLVTFIELESPLAPILQGYCEIPAFAGMVDRN
jgi:hypothetical protein